MKIIDLIGVPMDLGTNNVGASAGPEVYRRSGIGASIEALGYKVHDLGDVEVPSRETLKIEDESAKYLNEIVDITDRLSHIVEKSLDQGHFPLCLGGDHALALGSITGVAAYCRKNSLRLGIIWLDAHGDMNTQETSPSGNINGMPFAALLGMGHEKLVNLRGFTPKIKPQNCSLIGARCIDIKERTNIQALSLPVKTIFDIEKNGLAKILEDEISRLKATTDHIHVSLDIDAIDPSEAPGVGTPERCGLSFREACFIMDTLAESGVIQSFDINELNPILDFQNMTAEVGIELILSALGKKIL